MFSRSLAVATAVAAMIFLPAPAATMAASGPAVPADIQAVFDNQMIQYVRDDASAYAKADKAAVPLTTVDTVGAPHEIMTWSPQFRDGVAGAGPLVSQGEWVATLLANGTTVGVGRVWRDAGTATVAGYSGDVALGVALAAMGTDQLVEEPEANAFYGVTGNHVHALNPAAATRLGSKTSLTDFQDSVAAAAQRAKATSAVIPAAVGGNETGTGLSGLSPLATGLIGLLLGALAASGIFLARRRGKTTPIS